MDTRAEAALLWPGGDYEGKEQKLARWIEGHFNIQEHIRRMVGYDTPTPDNLDELARGNVTSCGFDLHSGFGFEVTISYERSVGPGEVGYIELTAGFFNRLTRTELLTFATGVEDLAVQLCPSQASVLVEDDTRHYSRRQSGVDWGFPGRATVDEAYDVIDVRLFDEFLIGVGGVSYWLGERLRERLPGGRPAGIAQRNYEFGTWISVSEFADEIASSFQIAAMREWLTPIGAWTGAGRRFIRHLFDWQNSDEPDG